jgi:hypothetical protein
VTTWADMANASATINICFFIVRFSGRNVRKAACDQFYRIV